MKNKILILVTSLFAFPLFANALSSSSPVYYGDNLNTCTSSKYQSNNILTNGSIYFGHCMEYKCSTDSASYYNNNSVSCGNGNNDPYRNVVKNGCDNLSCSSSDINRGVVKYCSVLMYYDCERKSDGSSFTTTTKTTTRKTTTKRVNTTTQTTTQAPKEVNSKLSSIELSSGSILFNPEVFSYDINVDNSVSEINVKAVPQDETSKVEISGNTNLINGSVINIKVVATDNSFTEYKINVSKKENVSLSNNSKLKSLNVENYKLNFNSKITDYTLIIDNGVNELNIDYELEDEKSTVMISGNNNLKSGSKIIIKVVAEDGSETNYNININVKKKSNFIKILFIIVLILSVIAGGYYIYKKIMNGKSGDKYEYE